MENRVLWKTAIALDNENVALRCVESTFLRPRAARRPFKWHHVSIPLSFGVRSPCNSQQQCVGRRDLVVIAEPLELRHDRSKRFQERLLLLDPRRHDLILAPESASA